MFSYPVVHQITERCRWVEGRTHQKSENILAPATAMRLLFIHQNRRNVDTQTRNQRA